MVWNFNKTNELEILRIGDIISSPFYGECVVIDFPKTSFHNMKCSRLLTSKDILCIIPLYWIDVDISPGSYTYITDYNFFKTSKIYDLSSIKSKCMCGIEYKDLQGQFGEI